MNKVLPIFLIFLLVACPNPPEPDDNDPLIVPQEQVDWPSLANSSAPMYHGGPFGNGLYFDGGPTEGIAYQFGDFGPQGPGIVTDEYGRVYATGENGSLCCLNEDGSKRWQLDLVDFAIDFPSPIVLNDGNIACFLNKYYFLISPEGEILLKIELPDIVYALSVNVDKEGNYYLSFNDNTLYSYSREGQLNWSVTPPDSLGDTIDPGFFIPVFTDDGNALVLKGAKYLYCITTTGQIRWIKNTTVKSPPIADSYGNIYYWSANDSMMTCIDSTGQTVWGTYTGGMDILYHSRPTITINGSIVVPTNDLELSSFSPNGEIQWQIQLPDNGYLGNGIKSELISDKNGNIYSSSCGGAIFIVSSSGDLIKEIPGPFFVTMSPSISENKLYFVTDIGGLYVVN